MSGNRRRYATVWAWLAALTAVEVLVAGGPLSRGVVIALLLGLSVWKALLVAMNFMHLRFESGWLKLAAAAPPAIAVMAIVLILTDSPLL